jgi:hypothetical protein
MHPLAQIGTAVLVFIAVVAGLFTAVAALIRISPSDPGPLEEDADGHDQA